MLITLIVPIYKVENYILECLKSIVRNLPCEKVEIILVDDGSPDQSIQLTKKYLSTLSDEIQKKFQLIEQFNQGLSAARNAAIDIAKGEYLAFLDSDDLLNENFFNVLINIIKKYNADIIEYDMYRFDSNGFQFEFLDKIIDEGFYNLDERLMGLISNQCAWYAPKRIYKNKLFSNIRFPMGTNFEDAHTIPYLYIIANNIYILNTCLMLYRVNPNSISNTKSEKNLEDLKGSILKMSNYLKDSPFLINSILSLSRMYILDVFHTKGFFVAYIEWNKLKDEINISKIKWVINKHVKSFKCKYFYYFGVIFIVLNSIKIRFF